LRYITLGLNEVDPCAPQGAVQGRYDDLAAAQRARCGDTKAEVVIDIAAMKSKERTSFLRTDSGKWVAVSYMAAISYCHGRYEISAVIQAVIYEHNEAKEAKAE
jgi:hypothetical protein